MRRFKVLNLKPDINALKQEGFSSVDMHFHSKYSDGTGSVQNIVKKAKKLGVGICITDHNEITGSFNLSKHKDVLSIPGIEITSKEGAHMLAYFSKISELIGFYSNHIEDKKIRNSNFVDIGVLDMIEKAKENNACVITPHPYGPSFTGIMNHVKNKSMDMSLFDKVHGVEAINGGDLKMNNRKATILALNLGKAITAGTDGHYLYELGKVVTYADAHTTEDFLEALHNKENFVIGKELGIIKKATSQGMKIPRQINKTPQMMRQHLRFGKHVIENKRNSVRDKFSEQKNIVKNSIGRSISRIMNGKRNKKD